MYREPTVTGRKPGLKPTVWTRRKKETFNQNRMKKQESKKKKKKEKLRHPWDNFKCADLNCRGARRRRGRARN